MSIQFDISGDVTDIARRTAEFVRGVVLPEERACGGSVHDAPEPLRHRLQTAARQAGIFAPHVYLAGQTVGAGFGVVGSAVPALLRAGLDTLRQPEAPRWS
ncbi:hypothetical protein [Sphaerisporangium perillae]|uniref:hypothetical protein n=1 Tax=Sphaerisporangium perillae TaxID=2935860 RepID=UPI0020109E2A|nr:hypothetical protein [Sphaerisporangium perillae]